MAQLKFTMDDELVKKFKQIVVAKHGKIQLKPEGEDAIRLYIKKNQSLLEAPSTRADPLKRVIGAVRSGKQHDALQDLKRLEADEL